jgi:biotin carboxyl carrier protein
LCCTFTDNTFKENHNISQKRIITMKMLRITLEGKTYDVGVEVLDDSVSALPQASHSSAAPLQPVPSQAVHAPSSLAAAPVVTAAEGCRLVVSPMAGHVFKCLVKPGDVVAYNQVLIVLDAMKMETPVVAPLAGIIRTVLVKEGDAVDDGHGLLQIEILPQ